MWTPASLTNLKVWCDAPSLGAANNDLIGTWTDLSGNGNSPTNTLALRPIYKTGITPTGAAVLRGLASNLQCNFTLATPIHLFLVIAIRTYVLNSEFCDGTSASDTMEFYDTDGAGAINLYSGADCGPVSMDHNFHLLEGKFNGAGTAIILDGGTPVTASMGNTTPSGLSLFSSPATLHPSAIDLAAIVLCSSIQSDADRALLKTYCQTRFGTP